MKDEQFTAEQNKLKKQLEEEKKRNAELNSKFTEVLKQKREKEEYLQSEEKKIKVLVAVCS